MKKMLVTVLIFGTIFFLSSPLSFSDEGHEGSHIVLHCSELDGQFQKYPHGERSHWFYFSNLGPVLDSSIIGSIEYLVLNKRIDTIWVVGHTNCTLFRTVIDGPDRDKLRGSVPKLLEPIFAAVSLAKRQRNPDRKSLEEMAVSNHTAGVLSDLSITGSASFVLRGPVTSKRLEVTNDLIFDL